MEDFSVKRIVDEFQKYSTHISKEFLFKFLETLEENNVPEPNIKAAVELSKIASDWTSSPMEAMAVLMMASGMIRTYCNSINPVPYDEKEDMTSCMLLAGAMFEACNIHLNLGKEEAN